MTDAPVFDIFLAAPPGLEPLLAEEARALNFADPRPVPGGVETRGGWPEVWRANLQLRGANRVLVRIAAFRAFHLAQLDKRARKVDWAAVLRPDLPVTVETVTNRKSKIYHAGAATQRIERAIAETLGAPIGGESAIALKVRIDDNLVTVSLDTSGEGLHKRGWKQAVGKAPLRETLAALFLRSCGHDGTMPVLDPMCGSGTIPIEAALWSLGTAPGRARAFAFEQLASFDAAAVAALRGPAPAATGPARFHGSDRDQGVIAMAQANAQRAGVAPLCSFERRPISEARPPDGPPGLILVNPPYGARIGARGPLHALYGSFGDTIRQHFPKWRVGLITSDGGLAKTTGLPFTASPPIPFGGLQVKLYQSAPLT